MAPRATVDLNRAHGLSQIMHCLWNLLCHTLQLLAKKKKSKKKEKKKSLFLLNKTIIDDIKTEDRWGNNAEGHLILMYKYIISFLGDMWSFLSPILWVCSRLFTSSEIWLLLRAFAELTRVLTKHHFCNVCNPCGFFFTACKAIQILQQFSAMFDAAVGCRERHFQFC